MMRKRARSADPELIYRGAIRILLAIAWRSDAAGAFYCGISHGFRGDERVERKCKSLRTPERRAAKQAGRRFERRCCYSVQRFMS
jgi:hypothetical protein